MKKVLLSVLLAAVAAGTVRAQVFQYLYGTPNPDILTDGHNTNLGGMPGHFLVSPSVNTPFLFSATRTNNAGVAIPAGPPYFNNLYRMSDVPLPPGAPNLRIQDLRSVEINTGMGYGLAGSYVQGNSANPMGVFYQQINPMGALMLPTTTGYFFNGPASMYTDVRVKKIINSTQAPGDMYILGTLTEAIGGYSRIFVLRINQAGVLLWSFIYRLDFSSTTNTDFPYDLVESVQMRGGIFELMVVGEHYAAAGGPSDGFLMRINSNTGGIINPVQFYGTAAGNEGFTCIKTSANPAVDGAGAGYVIGGYVENGSSTGPLLDFWFIALDQAGMVSWTNTFDYVNPAIPATSERCNDLIERQVNPGMFEYYLAGTVDNGIFGGQDMVVFRTNQFGNALPLGQFTYGTQNAQRCIRIDQSNFAAAGPGIAMYGSSFRIPQPPPPLGNFDLYLVKAGFNGATACDFDLRDPKQNRGPDLLMSKSSDHTNRFTSYRMYSRSMTTMDEYRICYSSTPPVTPSAFAKTLPEGPVDLELSPNPTSGMLELRTAAGLEQTFVTVLNAVGQEVGRKEISSSGVTLIDMSQLPTGIYLLRAEINGQHIVKKVVKN